MVVAATVVGIGTVLVATEALVETGAGAATRMFSICLEFEGYENIG